MTNNDCCLELEIELATIVDCRPCVDRRGSAEFPRTRTHLTIARSISTYFYIK